METCRVDALQRPCTYSISHSERISDLAQEVGIFAAVFDLGGSTETHSIETKATL